MDEYEWLYVYALGMCVCWHIDVCYECLLRYCHVCRILQHRVGDPFPQFFHVEHHSHKRRHESGTIISRLHSYETGGVTESAPLRRTTSLCPGICY